MSQPEKQKFAPQDLEALVAQLPIHEQEKLMEQVAEYKAALEREKQGTIAASALKIIELNIELARKKSQPICQDTGSVLFYVDGPPQIVDLPDTIMFRFGLAY